MKMMSSTALPKVTFNKAPIVSPSFAATLSVAKHSRYARGMIAIAFMAKTTFGLMGLASAFTLVMIPKVIPMGTKIRSQLIQLEEMIRLTSLTKRLPTDGLALFARGVGSSPSPSAATEGVVWVAEFDLLVLSASSVPTPTGGLIVSSCVVGGAKLVGSTRVRSEVEVE